MLLKRSLFNCIVDSYHGLYDLCDWVISVNHWHPNWQRFSLHRNTPPLTQIKTAVQLKRCTGLYLCREVKKGSRNNKSVTHRQVLQFWKITTVGTSHLISSSSSIFFLWLVCHKTKCWLSVLKKNPPDKTSSQEYHEGFFLAHVLFSLSQSLSHLQVV